MFGNRFLFLFGVILTTCCCCSFVSKFVTEEPKAEDIVGIYKNSKQNVVSEYVVSDKVSYIEIYPGGACNLVDFPVFFEDDISNYKFQEFFTGECSWVTTISGGLDIGAAILPVWTVCIDAVNFNSETKCANLVSGGKPYDLEFIFGDLDSNRMIKYEKISSN